MLNEDQSKLFDYVIECHKTKKDIKAVCCSQAGTGKTFFIKYLVNNSNLDIKILAPTHKSKGLFKSEGIEADTIHRFLNSKKNIDDKTGEIYFTMEGNYKSTHDLLIIDECSMINEKMFDELIKYKNILFIGDNHQLPPIGENISKVFDPQGSDSNIWNTFEFKKNMRIITNPDSISAHYLKKFRELVNRPTLKIRIEERKDMKFVINSFKKGEDTVVLAWTNKQVAFLNNNIRKSLYLKPSDTKLERYYVGEKLIFSGYRKTSIIKHIDELGRVKFLTYHSSDEIVIMDLKKESIFIDYHRCNHQKNNNKISICLDCNIKGHKVRGYNIHFYKITDENGTVWYYPEDTIDMKNINNILVDFRSSCLHLKDKTQWIAYYNMKNLYSPDIFYKYSMTIHKSQGSEFQNVFVDIGNIRHCRDLELAAKLSYTAVSRYRKYLYFI